MIPQEPEAQVEHKLLQERDRKLSGAVCQLLEGIGAHQRSSESSARTVTFLSVNLRIYRNMCLFGDM